MTNDNFFRKVFVCSITGNNYRLQHFPEFIQTYQRYPTSLDRKSILTWTLFVISNHSKTYSMQKYLMSVPAALSYIRNSFNCGKAKGYLKYFFNIRCEFQKNLEVWKMLRQRPIFPFYTIFLMLLCGKERGHWAEIGKEFYEKIPLQ